MSRAAAVSVLARCGMLWSVFERFSEQARLVVVRAHEYARDLEHAHIGTEHLLLALVGDGGEIPTRLLGSFGIDQEIVRSAVLAIVGIGEERSGGFLPFTARSKEAMESAMRESERLGDREIRPGHLLRGVIRDEDGAAVRVLLKLNVPVDELRVGLRARLADPDAEEQSSSAGDTREAPERKGPLLTANSRVVPADAEHRGPPDNYLVTRALVASAAPDDVRAMAEAALSKHGLMFDEVAFIAEVRDADATDPPAYPEWLVAVHGPSPQPAMIVRAAGSWAAASHRTAFGQGRSGTVLRVSTVERVEPSPGCLTPA